MLQQRREDSNQRRLSRSIRDEQREYRPALYVQIHTLEYGQLLIGLLKSLDLNGLFHLHFLYFNQSAAAFTDFATARSAASCEMSA